MKVSDAERLHFLFPTDAQCLDLGILFARVTAKRPDAVYEQFKISLHSGKCFKIMVILMRINNKSFKLTSMVDNTMSPCLHAFIPLCIHVSLSLRFHIFLSPYLYASMSPHLYLSMT